MTGRRKITKKGREKKANLNRENGGERENMIESQREGERKTKVESLRESAGGQKKKKEGKSGPIHCSKYKFYFALSDPAISPDYAASARLTHGTVEK